MKNRVELISIYAGVAFHGLLASGTQNPPGELALIAIGHALALVTALEKRFPEGMEERA